MQFTPEQKGLVEQAKARGEQRINLEFTPEQRAEWQKAVEEEWAAKDENIAHYHKVMKAAEQPGFFGDIRRAVQHSQRPIAELASKIGVEPLFLSDFLAADVELSASVLDRLIEVLGLRLMQEIPR
jgi:DNA-binding MarR family transcriptional regulator